MRGLVVSDSMIIREGLIKILKEQDIEIDIVGLSSYENLNIEYADIIVTDSNKSNLKYLSYLKQIKDVFNIKIMMLDFQENKNTFMKSIEYGFEAYILPNIDCENIPWALNQIVKGKKYHDISLLDKLNLEKKYTSSIILSRREKEVANLVSKGNSNQEIAWELFISINTVKKHITNILSKLGLKDRMQITIHILENGEL